jgi:hypothetical protein
MYTYLAQMNTENLEFLPPLVTREKWALLTGLSVPTIFSGCDRGFWPVVHVGRRVLINVEAVRLAAAKKSDFTL